ncbi:MAG: C25 family cysteine peptidase [Planctomycetota bacterium]|nr:C25 family cysteine peptidase [Planctomycetota bacterium]
MLSKPSDLLPGTIEPLEPRQLMAAGALIITTNSLAGTFHNVSDWYTRKGYPAHVLTTESIAAAYPGADLQAQIRNAIIDWHANHGVGYVLLGGDNTIVPDRDAYVSVGSYVAADMPTDLYYGSLTGTWDANGNGVYGEVADNVSLTYDVVVDPVRTADQAQIILDKVIAYETTPPSSNWATKMLGAGDQLWDTFAPGTYNDTTVNHSASDAELKTRYADSQYVQPYFPQRQLDYMFDTYTSWDNGTPGGYLQNSANLLSAMGNGYQFMHMATHGSDNAWGLESGLLTASDVLNMSQRINVPFISTIACNTGAFDRADASLSEAFLRSPNTGTIAYLGCSRYGWDYYGSSLGPSFRYSYEFYQALFSSTGAPAGDAFAASKEALAYASTSNGAYRWDMFSLNYQGDPLVSTYQHVPTFLHPTYSSSLLDNRQTFSVSSLPAGATVTLWQGDDVYVTGSANAHGVFTATIDPTAGQIKLTVTAQDAAVFTADVNVSIDDTPPAPYAIEGKTLTVTGTEGNDAFGFFVADGVYNVTLNGQTWTFSPGDITQIIFNSGGGIDSATLTGSASADAATLRPGLAQLIGSGYSVTLNDVAHVAVVGGANDTVSLFGTAGADTFEAHPDHAALIGPGYEFRVSGFGAVRANGQGGDDVARLYDSTGDDTLELHTGYGFLRGTGFNNAVENFARIEGYSTAGGNDVASLYDSSGDDTLTARPGLVTLAGPNATLVADGFASVIAYATAGGNDVAGFYDSAGDDVFRAYPAYATMTGQGYANRANGFESVTAYAAAGGTDTAYLYDSAGADTFVARPDSSYLFGAGFRNQADGFDSVTGYSTRGADTAWFYDSAGDDAFVSRRDGAQMSGEGYLNAAAGFKRVSAYSSAGNDSAALYTFSGLNTFTASSADATMSSSTGWAYASAFASVRAYGAKGDSAFLYDSAGDDTFSAAPNSGSLAGAGFANAVSGFGRISAFATAGGADTATFADSIGNDTFTARGGLSSMIGAAFKNYATGFEANHASSTHGGADRANLYDSAGADSFEARRNLAALTTEAGVLNDAAGFARVKASASLGGADTASVFDTLGCKVSRRRGYVSVKGVDFFIEASAFKQASLSA